MFCSNNNSYSFQRPRFSPVKTPPPPPVNLPFLLFLSPPASCFQNDALMFARRKRRFFPLFDRTASTAVLTNMAAARHRRKRGGKGWLSVFTPKSKGNAASPPSLSVAKMVANLYSKTYFLEKLWLRTDVCFKAFFASFRKNYWKQAYFITRP